MERKAYPSDVSDDEWASVAPYLTLMTEEAPQREQSLREVFNGLRWIVRAGALWRMMPDNLPPWFTVYQQTQRWINAGVFGAMVHDLRALLRLAKGRKEQLRCKTRSVAGDGGVFWAANAPKSRFAPGTDYNHRSDN